MSWIKKLPYEALHNCEWPDLEVDQDAGAGSVWACDECGRQWIVTNYLGELMWVIATGGATRLKEA